MDLSFIYELIPIIKCCTVKLDDEHYHYLNYNKNVGFIEALKIIGKNYGRVLYGDKKMTDYKLGIRYVRECTANQYHTIVSKSQIKRLARPHCRKHHAMKFPVVTYEILTIVRTLIDKSNQCISECKACKMEYCKRTNRDNMLCRDFLVGNFIDASSSNVGNIKNIVILMKLLNDLDIDLHNCNI